MTDHPMPFNEPMIRAILREIENPGTGKTKTRRILKIPPNYSHAIVSKRGLNGPRYVHLEPACDDVVKRQAPKTFATGDRLWVRETWSDVNIGGAPGIAYRANSEIQSLMDFDDFLMQDDSFNYEDPRLLFGKKKEPLLFANWHSDLLNGTEGFWRPSIHMPRWASRLTLTVTDVRVERLQDISEADARAEGIALYEDQFVAVSPPKGMVGFASGHRTGWSWDDLITADDLSVTPTRAFMRLWNSINGPEAWDQNPWVTATTFTPQLCNIDQMEKAA